MAKNINKNVNKPLRSRKIIFILSALLTTSMISSLTGTFAWFEYAARAGLNYYGTAVGETGTLDIGFYSEAILDRAFDYGLEQDKEYKHVYWSHSGLDAKTFSYYCASNGFAERMLKPTTSGQYESDDYIHLKPAPSYRQNYNPDLYAEKADYIHIPFFFRPSNNSFIGESKIGISLTDVKVEGTGNIGQGLRVWFYDPIHASGFIFNPNVEENGFNTVGGALDLNGDGFYDYHDNSKKEYFYGEVVDDSLIYKKDPSTNTEPLDEENRSTFNSAHAYGVYEIDNEASKFATAQYLGKQDVLLERILTSSIDPKTKVARLDTYIYVEGWAPTTIDIEAYNYFSLDLTFELQEI